MNLLERIVSAVEKRAEEVQDEWRRKCARMSDADLLRYYSSTLMKSEGESSLLLEIIEDELRRRHIRF